MKSKATIQRFVELEFGAFAPSIVDQLSKMNASLDPEWRPAFQEDADQLTRLHINGLLTDSQVKAARKKLMNRIVKRIKI